MRDERYLAERNYGVEELHVALPPRYRDLLDANRGRVEVLQKQLLEMRDQEPMTLTEL